MGFTNSFGDKVIGLRLEEGGNSGDALRPGAIVTDEISWKVNQFDDEWKAFRGTALSSMKAGWVPDQIIFTDGTSLKAPDSDS